MVKPRQELYQMQEEEYENPEEELAEAERMASQRPKLRAEVFTPQSRVKLQSSSQLQPVAQEIENVQALICRLQQFLALNQNRPSKYKKTLENALNSSKCYLLGLNTYYYVGSNKNQSFKGTILPIQLHQLRHNYIAYKQLIAKVKPLIKEQRRQEEAKKAKQASQLRQTRRQPVVVQPVQKTAPKKKNLLEPDSDQEKVLNQSVDSSIIEEEPEQDEDLQALIEEEMDDGLEIGKRVYSRKQEEAWAKRQEKRERQARERREAFQAINEQHKPSEIEEDEARVIDETIQKNRGMRRIRKKIDRNSRLKLRLKYEKALKSQQIKRRNVREVQDESYLGELTGVKSNRIKGVTY